MTGECKPGAFVCAPGPDGKWGWQCRGFAGPQMEICDGKDNDCDGVIDNMAMCPPNNRCVEGMCVPICGTGEFQCSADRTCRDGLCRLKACVGVTCPDTAFCSNETGMCVDYCATVTCAKGANCVRGVCMDCFNDPTRCKDGERCVAGECQKDPCAGVDCPNDSYCRAGACVKMCLEACPTGQACRDGKCVEDRCALANCAVNSFCDPADGMCKSDPCQLIQCMGGMACVKTTGKCATDPCLTTVCKGNDRCEPEATGEAQCVPPAGQVSTRQVVKVQSAGGGLTDCDCSLGGQPEGRPAPASLWLLITGAAALAFGRRRRS
jgi:hypothetical protein